MVKYSESCDTESIDIKNLNKAIQIKVMKCIFPTNKYKHVKDLRYLNNL